MVFVVVVHRNNCLECRSNISNIWEDVVTSDILDGQTMLYSKNTQTGLLYTEQHERPMDVSLGKIKHSSIPVMFTKKRDREQPLKPAIPS